MSTVDDLLAFIRRCLDEDERVAREAMHSPGSRWEFHGEDLSETGTGGSGYFATGPWGSGIDEKHAEHIVRWDPARVLAEVKAKRQILDLYDEVRDEVRSPVSAEHRTNARARQFVLEQVIALHAQLFAGRNGWREEWRIAPRHVPANEDVTGEFHRGDG